MEVFNGNEIILACVLGLVISGIITVWLVISRYSNMLVTAQTKVQLLDEKAQQIQIQLEHIQLELTQCKSDNNKLYAELTHTVKTQHTLHKKQLESLSSTIDETSNKHSDEIAQIKEQEPQDKFYSRAVKLASKGASRDEIINECDIPPVEVDMLLAIHQKK